MSALHRCPYCRMEYRYRELFRMKGRRQRCPGCGRTVTRSRRYAMLPLLIVCALLVAADTVMLMSIYNVSVRFFALMALADAVIILLTLLLCPLLWCFRKAEQPVP